MDSGENFVRDRFRPLRTTARLRGEKTQRLQQEKEVHPGEGRPGAVACGAGREKTQGHELRRILGQISWTKSIEWQVVSPFVEFASQIDEPLYDETAMPRVLQVHNLLDH